MSRVDCRAAAAYVFILLLAFFLIFYHLGDRLMWGDEAETALLAVNIEKFGLPKVSDGVNTITYMGDNIDTDNNGNWTWSPWLSEYLTAASFKLFGQSTTTARLPFAIAGFLSVALIAFVVYRIYGSHEISVMSMLLLSTSEVFVLHVRQCRYYSLVIFAEIVFIWGVYMLLKGRRVAGIALAAAALTIQFYGNYIVVAGSVAAFVVLAVISYKRYDRLWRSASAIFIFFTLTALPWIVYARPWRQAGYVGRENIAEKVVYYLWEMNFHIVALVIFIVPPIYILITSPNEDRQRQPADDIEMFLWILIPSVAASVSVAPGVYLRYLLPLLPAVYVLQSVILKRYIGGKAIRYILVLILCLTNYAAYYPLYPIKLLDPSNVPFKIHQPGLSLPTLIRETYAPYADRTGDVVRFLKKEGADGQSVYIADSGMSLIFYNGMRVINAKNELIGNLKELPDWIFTESVAVQAKKAPPIYPPKEIADNYIPISLKVHASGKSGSIPEPDMHESFASKDMEELLVFRKKADKVQPAVQKKY
ncbi:MAG: glycosyltransferase family 39 protein [Nitrospirae bacterium]|nr:glycosyltransferase family 39 protein [Nitrospirota bacterium]